MKVIFTGGDRYISVTVNVSFRSLPSLRRTVVKFSLFITSKFHDVSTADQVLKDF